MREWVIKWGGGVWATARMPDADSALAVAGALVRHRDATTRMGKIVLTSPRGKRVEFDSLADVAEWGRSDIEESNDMKTWNQYLSEKQIDEAGPRGYPEGPSGVGDWELYAIHTRNSPTFFLDRNQSGIMSRDHAKRIAARIVGPDNPILNVEKLF